MAGQNPFNSVGSIMAHGGEVHAAQALATGQSVEQVKQSLASRYTGATGEALDGTVNFATQMLAAGKLVNDLAPDAIAPLGAIPTNNFRSDKVKASGRYKVGVEITTEGQEGSAWFTVTLSDISNMRRAMGELLAKIENIRRQYPEKFTKAGISSEAGYHRRIAWSERIE